MPRQKPIPPELWDQIPPAAQAAVLGLILPYEQQLPSAPAGGGGGGSTAFGPPPMPGLGGMPRDTAADEGMAALVGKTFSTYTLGPLLAAGNTGGIFKATDNSKDGRLVAFQVIRPEIFKE